MTQVWPTEQIIEEYLTPCSPTDDWVYTDMKRYWTILDEDVPGFMNEYTLFINQNPHLDFIFMEKSCNITPVIVDFRFKFPHTDINPFSGEVIQSLVTSLNRVLYNVYGDIMSEADSSCVILYNNLELNQYTGEQTCDFRFILPNVITTARIVREIIVPRYIREVTKSKLHEKFNSRPDANWENIIRTPCADLAISMYGSRCMNGNSRFRYSCTYEYSRETDSVAMCSLTPHHKHQGSYSVDVENINFDEVPDMFEGDEVPFSHDGVDEAAIYYLPFMFSHYYSPSSVISPKRLQVLNVEYDLDNFARTTIFEKLDRKDHIDLFIDMWSDSRFSMFHYWKTVGEAIFDAYVGSNEGLAHWIDITKDYLDRCNVRPRYLEKGATATCSKYYRTFKCDRVTIRSLAWHAREDSPDEYQAWHDGWIREAFEAAAYTKLHTDVAAAFYRMFWLDYMCTGAKKSFQWYHFYHSHLEEANENVLKDKLSTDFIRAFESMMLWMRNQEASASGAQRQKCGEIIESIAKLIELLKTSGYRANIISEAKVYFDNPYMRRHINTDPEMMGMINSVLVATSNEIFIRPGRPEDYITKEMGIGRFSDRYNNNHPDVLRAEEWIAQMFVDVGMRRHFKKFLASLLRGGNRDKRFYVFTGVGNNSKSMCIDALRRLFNDYCVKLDTAAFTRQRSDANGPSPAFARTDGTRLVITEEPEGKASFNAALVNNLTGIDTFNARNMKENGKQIIPLFKLIMVCNKIPVMDGGGKAIRNRLSAIPFLSTWVDNPPLDIAEQYRRRLFKIDTNFDSNLDEMLDPLFYIAKENYQTYLDEGVRNETSEIRKATESYWEETDVLMKFTRDNFYHVCNPDGSPNMKASISLDEAYDTYKIWFKSSCPGRRQPDKTSFENDMIHRWGPLRHNKWYSVALKDTMPDQEEKEKDEVYEEEDLTSLSAGLLWGSKPLDLLKPVYVTSEQLDSALKAVKANGMMGSSSSGGPGGDVGSFLANMSRTGQKMTMEGTPFNVSRPGPKSGNSSHGPSSCTPGGSMNFFNPLATGIPLTSTVQ